MKRLYLALLIIGIATSLAFAQSFSQGFLNQNQGVSITTYYPAPYSEYKTLRLYPESDGSPGIGQACADIGTMYYDKDDYKVLYCDASNTFQEIGGGSYWEYDDPDLGCVDYLYPKFSNVHIGIGTETPEFKLSLDNDGGIFLMGKSGGSCGSSIGTVGSGPRLIFNSVSSVFRVGDACGTDWDGVNTKTYSATLGYCANADTSWAAAIGTGANTVYGTGSGQVAVGFNAQAIGDYSLALGTDTIARGGGSSFGYTVAIGRLVDAATNYSMVIGKGIESTSTALTNNSQESLMIGFNSDVPTVIVGPSNPGVLEGSVGIWIDTPPDNTVYALQVGGPAGGFNTDWDVVSDKTLKKDIKTIDNALDKVRNLRGVNFQWKDPNHPYKGTRMGIVAQEAKDIIPEVTSKPDKYYHIQYEPIVALLIEAIKEQQVEIEELKTRIKAKQQGQSY